jgi:CelD/BcsL family acetyltransferase involved in cellulose biosynthesis
MASALETDWRGKALGTRPGSLTNVRIINDLSEAEPYWRALQARHAVSTPYQGFEFLAAWHRDVGAPRGVTPFVVIGFDARGEPRCLLPWGLQRSGVLRHVSFLGGRHANYNFGLWDREAAASIAADDLQVVLDGVGASPHRPDLLTLYSQPRTWQGVHNPFLLLPHRPAPSNGACLIVEGPGAEVIEREVGGATRGRLRTKERKLQKLPGYRYVRVTRPEEVDRLMDRFVALKSAHTAAQGLPNVFAEPGAEAFLRAACHDGLGEGRPAIELHCLECDAELLAVFGVLPNAHSLSVMINTYTLSENARHSPGLILILHLIQACADRGIRSFDLGVGDAQYKSWFCKQPVVLFDSFLPLTPRGRLSAIGLDTANVLKREIKNTPALWSMYRSLRKAFSRPGRRDSAAATPPAD